MVPVRQIRRSAMYLSGELSVDPSAMTKIKPVRPTKGFAKVWSFMSNGLNDPKLEHETFTAIAILQQINIALRSAGITNIVRIAKDDTVYYYDDAGKEDDLKEALEAFELQEATEVVQVFDTINLVAEHSNGLRFIIDVKINRSHDVGQYPISIVVNAVSTEFMPKEGETPESMKERVNAAIGTQEKFDAFVGTAKATFDTFTGSIEQALRSHVGVDDIKRTTLVNFIRPTQRPTSREYLTTVRSGWTPSHARSCPPIFYGYYGFDDAFLYAWVLADVIHDNSISCHDCVIMDESGGQLMEIGSDDASQLLSSEIFDMDQEFVAPEPEVAAVASESDASPLDLGSYDAPEVDSPSSSSDSGGGWFDSGGDSGGSASSCSSGDSGGGGGSCGGGCGGGD